MALHPKHSPALCALGWLTLAMACQASYAQAAPPSAPSRVYYDYASVISVTEIRSTAGATAPDADCRIATDARNASQTGATARRAATESIASAILRDFNAGGACEGAAPARSPVGYEVRYRYGERVYQRVMANPPGERLRVRVQLAPNLR